MFNKFNIKVIKYFCITVCLFNTTWSSQVHSIKQDTRTEKEIKEYYLDHAETYLDKVLRYFSCKMGSVVHGDLNQDQLQNHLKGFDCERLLRDGPYENSILSIEAQKILFESLDSFDYVFDIHLHNLGYDEGNYLNPKASVRGKAEWMNYLTFMVLRYAAGMSNPHGSTQEARKRIQLYVEHFPKLKAIILPIHKAILEDGTNDWENTGSYLTNKSALQTALSFQTQTHTSEIFPAVSVHPFDPLWQEKLLNAHSKGIRLIKWMPPQSIPPDSDLLNDYYALMKNLEMVLIAHAGVEHAIPTTEGNAKWQDYGNPLRFRKPLEMGVNVILAHCGHKDELPDLDHCENHMIEGYKLFFRLAEEAHQKNLSGEWSGKLYGDLAAVTTHYGVEFIKELLSHTNQPGVRLIYGSDFPYTNLIKTSSDAYEICAKANLLEDWKVQPLKEIRNWNPLLANLVFTQQIQWNKEGKILKFQDETFTANFKDGELILYDRDQWHLYKHNSME